MVEIAPHSRKELFDTARRTGVKEGSVAHRVLERELSREKTQLRVAKAHRLVLAEMADAQEALNCSDRRKSAVIKAKLAKKAHPKVVKLRKKQTEGLIARIDSEIAATKRHRARMQLAGVEAKAADRRHATTIASYRSMKRARS